MDIIVSLDIEALKARKATHDPNQMGFDFGAHAPPSAPPSARGLHLETVQVGGAHPHQAHRWMSTEAAAPAPKSAMSFDTPPAGFTPAKHSAMGGHTDGKGNYWYPGESRPTAAGASWNEQHNSDANRDFNLTRAEHHEAQAKHHEGKAGDSWEHRKAEIAHRVAAEYYRRMGDKPGIAAYQRDAEDASAAASAAPAQGPKDAATYDPSWSSDGVKFSGQEAAAKAFKDLPVGSRVVDFTSTQLSFEKLAAGTWWNRLGSSKLFDRQGTTYDSQRLALVFSHRPLKVHMPPPGHKPGSLRARGQAHAAFTSTPSPTPAGAPASPTPSAVRPVAEAPASPASPPTSTVAIEHPPSHEMLEDLGLLREFGGRWQYRPGGGARGGGWYTANSLEGALADARHEFDRMKPEERLTKAQRDARDEAEYAAETHRRYGHMSLPEMRSKLVEINKHIATNAKAAERQFTGGGGRRTSAAVSANAVNEFGAEKLRLERAIADREASTTTAGAARPALTEQQAADLARHGKYRAHTETHPSGLEIRVHHKPESTAGHSWSIHEPAAEEGRRSSLVASSGAPAHSLESALKKARRKAEALKARKATHDPNQMGFDFGAHAPPSAPPSARGLHLETVQVGGAHPHQAHRWMSTDSAAEAMTAPEANRRSEHHFNLARAASMHGGVGDEDTSREIVDLHDAASRAWRQAGHRLRTGAGPLDHEVAPAAVATALDASREVNLHHSLAHRVLAAQHRAAGGSARDEAAGKHEDAAEAVERSDDDANVDVINANLAHKRTMTAPEGFTPAKHSTMGAHTDGKGNYWHPGESRPTPAGASWNEDHNKDAHRDFNLTRAEHHEAQAKHHEAKAGDSWEHRNAEVAHRVAAEYYHRRGDKSGASAFQRDAEEASAAAHAADIQQLASEWGEPASMFDRRPSGRNMARVHAELAVRHSTAADQGGEHAAAHRHAADLHSKTTQAYHARSQSDAGKDDESSPEIDRLRAEATSATNKLLPTLPRAVKIKRGPDPARPAVDEAAPITGPTDKPPASEITAKPAQPPTASEVADKPNEHDSKPLAQLHAEIAAAREYLDTQQAAVTRASVARQRLPPGSTRARTTTAEANWANAAEARDKTEHRLDQLEAAARRVTQAAQTETPALTEKQAFDLSHFGKYRAHTETHPSGLEIRVHHKPANSAGFSWSVHDPAPEGQRAPVVSSSGAPAHSLDAALKKARRSANDTHAHRTKRAAAPTSGT